MFLKSDYVEQKKQTFMLKQTQKKKKNCMGLCGSSKQFRIVYFIGFVCLNNKLNKYIIVSKVIILKKKVYIKLL